MQLKLIPIHIINNHLPSDSIERQELFKFIDIINNKEREYSLNDISGNIFLLSSLANLNFKPFQIKEINEWFNNLIR